jgi:hypothetical protein
MAVLIIQPVVLHIQRAVEVAQEQWDRLRHHLRRLEQAGLEQTVVSLVRLLRMRVAVVVEFTPVRDLELAAWEAAVRAPLKQLLLPEQSTLAAVEVVLGTLVHLVQVAVAL